MSWFDRWRTVKAVANDVADRDRDAGPRFDVIDQSMIASELFGLPSWTSSWASMPGRLSRREAISVPAVKKARDLICGTTGRLPMYYRDKANNVHEHPLLSQPERHKPRCITMIETLEDLLFDEIAVWRITETDYAGYPTKVVRLESGTVDIRQDQHVYVKPDGTQQGTAWTYVPDDQIIRFYSPTHGLLGDAGSRAIRTALQLDAAAARYADDPMAQGYFRAIDGADPLVDEQGAEETDAAYALREGNRIKAIITNWRLARQQSATGYVPAGLEYVPLDWDPAQLQLAEGRQHAVLEVARLTGIAAEDLDVSTTSRTYQNSTQKREELVDYCLSLWSDAMTDRLSMPDVSPRGYTAAVDFSGFTRADEKTRMETYGLAATVGAYGPEEVQRREQLPAWDKPKQPAIAAAPAAADPPAAAAGQGLRIVNGGTQ